MRIESKWILIGLGCLFLASSGLAETAAIDSDTSATCSLAGGPVVAFIRQNSGNGEDILVANRDGKSQEKPSVPVFAY